ncbi:hypothetical protein MKEN_01409800 [Mycena kentingensis (nom. inval.)]|nr:hypothetical protein MKEN_01409800 [Mycena kentingensis (nom. inval.)]
MASQNRCIVKDAPNEVLMLICEQASPDTLVALCQTSRPFLDVAQHVLFYSIDLLEYSSRRLRSWCLAIRKHPHLAQRVHTLCIGLPDMDSLPPDNATRFLNAIQSCINLKELEIRSILAEEMARNNGSWLLEGCTFALTHLTNTYFSPGHLMTILRNLPALRFLSFPASKRGLGDSLPSADAMIQLREEMTDEEYESEKMPDLPHLIAFDGHAVELQPEWRLERIQVTFEEAKLEPLFRYSSTLTTLNLVSQVYNGRGLFSASTAVNHVSRNLPNLLHFAVVDPKTDVGGYWAEVPVLAPECSVQRFTRLETFTLIVRDNVDAFATTPVAAGGGQLAPGELYVSERPADMELLAQHTIEACPTLRRVVIGVTVMDFNIITKEEATYTATRAPMGEVEVVVGDEIDFEPLSMFWV